MNRGIASLSLVALTFVSLACSKPEEKKAEEKKPAAMKIACNDSINSLGDKAKDGFTVTCPASCSPGSLWGTDTYTTDSSLCTAARHAGVIKEGGGDFTVTFADGKKSYKGSERNGVTSSDWGPFDKSFTVK